MASVFEESFNGADGSSLSTSNTGFTGVVNPAIFSTSVKKSGTASAHFQTAGSYSYVERSFSAAVNRHWSFYLYPTAAPSANTVVFYAGTSTAAADRRFQVTLNTDLTVKVQQGSTAIIVGSDTASSLPLNQWSRIDVSFDSGAVSMSVYPGDAASDSSVGSAAAGNSVSGVISSTAISYLYLGVGNGTTNNLYIDEFRENDSELPGPISPATVEPYLYYDNGSEWVDVTENLYYDNGSEWLRVEDGTPAA